MLLLLFFTATFLSFGKHFPRLSPLLGLGALLLLAFCGFYRKSTLEPSRQGDHLLNVEKSIDFYKCVLTEDPQEKTNTWAFQAEVLAVKTEEATQKASGLMQVYLRKDEVAAALLDSLKYGAVLWVSGSPEEIRPLRNPGGFDFKQYMARKYILFQDYVVGEDVMHYGFAPPSVLMETSLAFRRQLLYVLKLYLPEVKERAIAEALILGYKDEIDLEQRNAYATAGAMHILAVSGLHVGIIYMIVGLLLKPVEKRKYGRYIRLLVLFFCLWFFAFITGLSASVLRAVIMFSIVLLAEGIKRKPNIYNSLALAAWLLLLYDPNFLFQVGYQLSFLAVLGIVYLQPKLYALWEAPNLLLDRVWGITCVSIAAQLATGPLSMFYFNQFPTWFLVSNLLVIPGAFLVLSAGIVLFVLHYISGWLAAWFAYLLQALIMGMNWFVAFVERLPVSLIWPVSFSAFQVWTLYVLIFSCLAWWAGRKYRWYLYSAAVVLVFVFSRMNFIAEKHRKKELLVYDMSGYTALNYQASGRVFHYFDEAFREEKRLYNLNVRPHLIQEGTLLPFVSHAGNWLPQRVVIPDTLMAVKAGALKILHLMKPLPAGRAPEIPLETDLLLVSHNSLKPDELGSFVQAGEIIFDGTNRYSYLSRTVEALRKKEQQVYVVPWEGAYVRQVAPNEAL